MPGLVLSALSVKANSLRRRGVRIDRQLGGAANELFGRHASKASLVDIREHCYPIQHVQYNYPCLKGAAGACKQYLAIQRM